MKCLLLFLALLLTPRPASAIDASGIVKPGDIQAGAIVEGLIVVTVSGSLELWWAPEVAAGARIKAGTSLILTKTSP